MTAPTSLAAERRSRRSFQAADVVKAAGISYRQLDYWTRTGLVDASGHETSGSGDTRWYRDTDVLRVAVVAALVNAGLSLAHIRRAIDQLLDESNYVAALEAHDVRITIDLAAIRTRIDGYRRGATR